MSEADNDSLRLSQFKTIVRSNKATREGTGVNLDHDTHYNNSANGTTAFKSNSFNPMRRSGYVPPPVTAHGNFSNQSGCVGGNPILEHSRYPPMSDKQMGRWSSEMKRSNRTVFDTKRRSNPNRNSQSN